MTRARRGIDAIAERVMLRLGKSGVLGRVG
jgi:hypothetical protein